MKTRLMLGMWLGAIGLLLAANLVIAQEATKGGETGTATTAKERRLSVDHLDIVVREFEDSKRINSRSYSLSTINNKGPWTSVRAGSKVPTGQMESEGYKGVRYQDVGINIDCRTEYLENQILLSMRFESSSIVTSDKATEGPGSPYPVPVPVFRQVKFDGDALLPPGKPTVIATVDDVGTNRRYEIEVTVTKVK